MSPTAGSRFGDTTVRLQGTGFHSLTKVFFDGVELPADRITVVSVTALDVKTAAHVPGAVAVALKNPDSAQIAAPSQYTFEAFAITDMTPKTGTTCGGAEVTLTGTSFHAGVEVKFGATVAADVTVVSEREILVVSPQVSEGTGLVTVTLAYGGLTVNGSQFSYTGIQFIRGDANGDGSVTMADPQLILDFLHGMKPLGAPLDAADADDNGLVNSNDARYLYTYLLGSGPVPTAPFPSAGTDPTPDGLVGCGN